MDGIFLGIDVGTGSARAGLFDAAGKLLAAAKRDIRLWRERGDIAEQSTQDIWRAVCESTREAMALSHTRPEDVNGIGFDATCSLVVVDRDGTPISVSSSGDPSRNIIVWMDHRARAEAAAINSAGHEVLRYVGSRISPEMETPKLRWLKANRPETFAKVGHFFDLADYLTWRATGSTKRSICTVTCKWTYLAHEGRWDESYFRSIGLGELADEGFTRIGTEIVEPGTVLGAGLTAAAAHDMGLAEGTPVGAGMIDAHAGGIGTVGASGADRSVSIESRLAYVFGTSACSMASTRKPAFVDGVWGPYFSAMVPGLWLNEGGQSAAGAALDHLVRCHPAHAEVLAQATQAGTSLMRWLEKQATSDKASLSEVVQKAKGLHVVPEFLGNRSPLADPEARGIIAGLDLATDITGLASLYVAGVCGLGYGLRQLINALAKGDVQIDMIVVSGGAAQSALARQLLADATGISIGVPETAEPVLLGAAILGAKASGVFEDVRSAMAAMSRIATVIKPATGEIARIHSDRFKAFEELQALYRNVRAC